jgi:hypothetical protein
MTVTEKDYEKILTFYKIKIPRSKRLLEKKAHDILASKLCRCIKKVDIENEAKSIGICTKTIFNRKGFKRGNFTCKKKQKVDFRRIRNKTIRKK